MKETARVASMVMIVSFGILLWMGTACAEEPDYFPLQVGNRWVYQWFVNEVGTDRTFDLFISERIEINGQVYFVLMGSLLNFLGANGFWPPYDERLPVRVDSSHRVFLWARKEIAGVLLEEGRERLWYDFNFHVPYEWTSWSLHYPMRSAAVYHMWPDLESVDTPAGTFEDVIKLSRMVFLTPDSWSPDLYFAPDVGLVRMDMFPQVGNERIQLLLRKASVNGVRYPRSSTLTEVESWGKIKKNLRHK